MPSYPATLPAPDMAGFAGEVDMGVIRSDLPARQAQRRVHNVMPHSFTIAFTMTVAEWGRWYIWALASGYHWFTLDLPTLYAGLGSGSLSPVTIRLTGPIMQSALSSDAVRVTVEAEIAPSAIGAFLANT